jgi:hypothetical protein
LDRIISHAKSSGHQTSTLGNQKSRLLKCDIWHYRTAFSHGIATGIWLRRSRKRPRSISAPPRAALAPALWARCSVRIFISSHVRAVETGTGLLRRIDQAAARPKNQKSDCTFARMNLSFSSLLISLIFIGTFENLIFPVWNRLRPGTGVGRWTHFWCFVGLVFVFVSAFSCCHLANRPPFPAALYFADPITLIYVICDRLFIGRVHVDLF